MAWIKSPISFALPGKISGVFRAFRRDRRGATAIEFAFIVPIFVVLMIGVVEFSRILSVRSSMQFAVEETTRYAMVNDGSSNTTLIAMVKQKIAAPDPENISVSITTETTAGVKYLKINASYPITMITEYFGLDPLTLTGSSRVPVME